jgi:DNA phosphorothioation-dependent restriction protein DptG
MAHFAKLGVGNIVERVEVVSNDIATTEQAGVDFLNNLYKTRDVWKQTSYNNQILEKIMLVLVIIRPNKRCFYCT